MYVVMSHLVTGAWWSAGPVKTEVGDYKCCHSDSGQVPQLLTYMLHVERTYRYDADTLIIVRLLSVGLC